MGSDRAEHPVTTRRVNAFVGSAGKLDISSMNAAVKEKPMWYRPSQKTRRGASETPLVSWSIFIRGRI